MWVVGYTKDTRKWYQKLYKSKDTTSYTLKTVTNYVPLEDFQVRSVERRTFATVEEK